MKNLFRLTAALLLVVPTVACDAGSDEPLVARAADHELTVNEAVRLLAGEAQLPNQPQVVEALGNLWIDYTLLAQAASRDSTLADLDMSTLIDQQLETEMIMALRDSVVQVDTSFTDEELEGMFRQNAPGVRIRARHVLLSYPSDASQAQRDSIRQQLQDLRRRVEAGESFEELAQEHSQDRASAVQGGDLGFFNRGEMVEPFDEAAFALEPGEMSDVVETPFGLHLIRVEEKDVPTFDDRRAEFRQQMQQQRQMEAESTFVADIQEGGGIEAVENAAQMTRGIAESPEVRLSSRAAKRPVMEYEGGAVTLGEVRTFLQTRPPQYLQQVVTAPDDVIEENVLKGLAQRELLIAAARERGLEPSQTRTDSLADVARENFREAARQIGFMDIRTQEGESRDEAVQRVVTDLLRNIVRGQQDVVPLGPIAWTLRQQYEAELVTSGIQRVVDEVAAIRGPQQPGATPQQPQGGQPPTGAQPPGGEQPPAQQPPPVQPPAGGQQPPAPDTATIS